MNKMTFWECVKQLLTAFALSLLMLILVIGLFSFAVLGIAGILTGVGSLFS